MVQRVLEFKLLIIQTQLKENETAKIEGNVNLQTCVVKFHVCRNVSV